MKTFVLFPVATIALFAQAPVPPAISGDTVIATVGGKAVTADQIRRFIDTAPPTLQGAAQLADVAKKSPAQFLNSFALINYLAAEAEKHKLAEEAPYQEQIASARQQILANAMVYWERNFNYVVTNEQAQAYYQSNLANYQQVHIRGIKIAFKPAAVTTVTSQQDVAKAAEAAVQAAHAASDRNEADAKKLAGELVEKARGGADFAKLVADYSDDADSKASGGDFGMVKPTSSYSDAVKKAVLSSKTGDVTDPIRDAAAFYIFKVEEKTTQSLNDVHEDVVQRLKEDHVRQYLGELYDRFQANIQRPDFFFQLNAGQK
jgi:parvulin-like peptidyl-prolyl isomerase